MRRDLTVAPFEQRHLVPGIRGLAQQFDAHWGRLDCRRAPPTISASAPLPTESSTAIVVREAECRAQLLDLLLRWLATDLTRYVLAHATSVGQLLRQLAVIGQQQQTFAQVIESPTGYHPALRRLS